MLQQTLANDRENAAIPGSPDNVRRGSFSFKWQREQTELQILGSRKPTDVAALELYEHRKMCAECHMHFSVVLSVLLVAIQSPYA